MGGGQPLPEPPIPARPLHTTTFAHMWVLQQDVAKYQAQANLCHLSEICCTIGQVWPGSQAIQEATHTFKELPHNISQ